MKIVYSHLLKLLEQQPKLEELSELLFQLGHEHEIDGEVLDMEITPNRGDCLSPRLGVISISSTSPSISCS